MNVIIANERQNELSTLDVDIIKSMVGCFDADEIVGIFRNFYFNKMILDLTAIRDFLNISNIQKLAMGLDMSKVILFLPNIAEVSSSVFLSRLVSMGIYNYTNNIPGVKYLINHTNTHADVAQVQQIQELATTVKKKVTNGCKVLGIKNVTDHAGATTLIFMLKKELERIYGETVYAIEVNKHDLSYFNVRNCISTNKEGVSPTIRKLSNASVILIDLNENGDDGDCDDVLYLIEPSSIRLNKLMRVDRNIFSKLNGKKIILNKSMLSSKEVKELEYEANARIFYSVPPLDDRRKNEEIMNLIRRVDILDKGEDKEKGKIFGLFKF